MKTSELTGTALDLAVAKCEGFKKHAAPSMVILGGYSPSTNWAQGGPIIEREHINLSSCVGCAWRGSIHPLHGAPHPIQYGETALIAAMRCYVASKLGDEVDIPEELLTNA